MIEMPRRSVTRFFIPMIDVLTLLFCIYLLMPMVAATPDPDGAEGEEAPKTPEQELQKLREEVQRLREAQGKELKERVALRVLEIDGKTGRLYYRDPERVEIGDQEEARELIADDRRSKDVGARELTYLILYPRERSGFPTRAQRAKYEAWFKGVILGFDRPGQGPGGG